MSSTFYEYECSFQGLRISATQTDNDPPRYWNLFIIVDKEEQRTERFGNKGLERHVRRLLAQKKIELTLVSDWSCGGDGS